MNCTCGSESVVIDNRLHESGNVWRRRQCKVCDRDWTTIEMYCGPFVPLRPGKKTKAIRPPRKTNKPPRRPPIIMRDPLPNIPDADFSKYPPLKTAQERIEIMREKKEMDEL